jgi:hypothetical protein
MITIKIQTKGEPIEFSARKIVYSPIVDIVVIYGAVSIPELLQSFRAPNGSLRLPTYMHIEVE